MESQCNYDSVGEFDYPTRELPPSQPVLLPCAPTAENISRLEQFIRERYNVLSFNNCCSQKISTLQCSPPRTLNVDSSVKPTACHKPAAVPLHWQEVVQEALERDVRIGVLERFLLQ